MKSLAEFTWSELRWVRSAAFRREYELRAGDELAAVLRIDNLFGAHAAAESGDGCWEFERVGFWRNKVTVRAEGNNTHIAVFKISRWGDGGGMLQLADGRKFSAAADFWGTDYEFRNEAGEFVLRLISKGVMRASAKIEVHSGADRLPEPPWLVMLGWYLVLTMKADAASATM